MSALPAERKKCRYVVEALGFDACIDHRAPDFAEQLAAACPQGIDIYYENVGGAVFDAVLPLLNAKARIPVCGIIAHYNATGLPAGPDRLPLLEGLILRKRIRMQGFIIFDDYGSRFDEFLQQMSSWVEQGKNQVPRGHRRRAGTGAAGVYRSAAGARTSANW